MSPEVGMFGTCIKHNNKIYVTFGQRVKWAPTKYLWYSSGRTCSNSASRFISVQFQWIQKRERETKHSWTIIIQNIAAYLEFCVVLLCLDKYFDDHFISFRCACVCECVYAWLNCNRKIYRQVFLATIDFESLGIFTTDLFIYARVVPLFLPLWSLLRLADLGNAFYNFSREHHAIDICLPF